jgi:hypothetical protein
MKFWNFAQGHIEVYSVDYGAFTAFQYGLQDRNSCPNIVLQWLGQRFSNCGGRPPWGALLVLGDGELFV